MDLMKVLFAIIGCLFVTVGFSQKEKPFIAKGNEYFRQKDYQKAAEQYRKALENNPASFEAQFNLGNSLYLMKKPEEARQAFQEAYKNSKDKGFRSQSAYNEGVLNTREKKLQESIESYKQALRLNAQDNDARENLQLALNELKKKQDQNQQNQNNKNKSQDQNKQDQPQNNNNSKLNKNQAEKMLNALRQEEKKLQQDVQNKNKQNGGILVKDW